MLKLAQLNGWQRLWIVITIIYLIPVVIFSWSAMPTQSQVDNAYMYETIDFVKDNNPWLSKSSYSIRESYKDISDLDVVKLIHDRYKNTYTDIDFDRIDNSYLKKSNELFKNQARTVFYGLIGWLLPSASVYLLGYSIVWIKKGFIHTNHKNIDTDEDLKTEKLVSSESKPPIVRVYKWFYRSYCLIWISLLGTWFAIYLDFNWFIYMCLACMAISYFAYLYTLGKLVAYLNKSVITWVGLTFLTKFLGVLVSYFSIKPYAVKEGWV